MLSAKLNMNRRMGAEFECFAAMVGSGNGTDVQRTFAEVLTANGIRAIHRGYQNSPLPRGVDVAVEYDASVRGTSELRGVTWNL